METADWIAVIAWSLACAVSVAAVVGLLFHNQLIRWGRRLHAARLRIARHRITVEETPVFDMPEIIRDLINRQRQDPQEGRGRHWAVDALHGETMALPVVVLPPAVDGELVGVSAEPALVGA